MLPKARLLLAVLSLSILATGCADLLQVPPPPVPLSAIDASFAGGDWDGDATALRSGVRLLRAAAPGSLLTLHLPDIAGTIRRFRDTTLSEIFSSKEFATLLGPLVGGMSGFSLTGSGAPPPMVALLNSMQGEVVISLQDVRLDDASGKPDVHALAAISVRGAEHQAEEFVQFIGMMIAGDRSITVEKGTHHATPYTRIVGKTPMPYVVELSVFGDALLVGLGRDTVTAAITRVADSQAETMAEDGSLRRCMERCADPRDAFRVHLDVGGALAKFGRLLPTELQQVIAVLGLKHVRAVSAAMRIEGKDIAISTVLDSPGGQDFLTKLFAAHSVDRQFLGRIPADATSFTLFAIDGGTVLRHLGETLPEKEANTLKEGLSDMRRAGLDLGTDVFEVFGPRCALVSMPTPRRALQGVAAVWERFLGTALVVEVHDADRAAATIAKLPRGGVTVHRREVLIEGTPAVLHRFETVAALPSEFTLGYAMQDGYLVIALSEETLQRMLRPRTADTEQRYRDLLSTVPESVSLVSYDDMRTGLGVMADAFFSGFHMATQQTPGGAPAAAPNFDLLLDGTEPALSFTVADQRGIYTYTRSPTGGLGGTGGISGLLVTASIALPNLMVARAQANEMAALTALQSVRTAQETYRSRVVRDGDSDGEGEFGLLADLMAKPRPGERRASLRAPLLTGFTAVEGVGWSRSGYLFRVYLPAEDGSPIGDHEGAARHSLIDSDLAETVMILVAWPASRGSSGTKAYLMDASGVIWQCNDGGYGDTKSPAPDLLCSQKGNLASQALPNAQGMRDGNRWVKLRE